MRNKRKKVRRIEDRKRNKRILHAAKRLLAIEEFFNQNMDELLDALDLTREEISDG